MRYLLLILAFLPLVAFARFDWVMGQPAVVYDATSATDPTRFDWVQGQPALVYDATYTAPATGGGGDVKHDVFWYD